MNPRTHFDYEFVAAEAMSRLTCASLGHKSGRVLATGTDDSRVSLWAIGRADCILSFLAHRSPIECVRFGPAELTVAAGTTTGLLKLWDLEAARLLKTFYTTVARCPLRCVEFHPFGAFLASASADGNIKLWDVRCKNYITNYKEHTLAVNSVRFSPDGQWLVSVSDDHSVKLWDLRAGKKLTQFDVHDEPVIDVQFHPQEFFMASISSKNGVLCVYDLETFQVIYKHQLNGQYSVRCLIYSWDSGASIYIGCHDNLLTCCMEAEPAVQATPTQWSDVCSLSMLEPEILISATISGRSVYVKSYDLLSRTDHVTADRSVDDRVSPGSTRGTTPPVESTGSPSYTVIAAAPNLRAQPLRVKNDNGGQWEPGITSESAEECLPTSPIIRSDDYQTVFQPRSRDLNRTPPLTENTALCLHPDHKRTVFAPVKIRVNAQDSSSSTTLTSSRSLTSNLNQLSDLANVDAPDICKSAKAQSTAQSHSARPHNLPTASSGALSQTVVNRNKRSVLACDVTHCGPCNVSSATMTSSNYSVVQLTNGILPVDEFLPKRSENLFSPLTEHAVCQPMDSGGGRHSEGLPDIGAAHQPMLAILLHRRRQLEHIYSIWCCKDARAAFEHLSSLCADAVNCECNLSVLVDVLGEIQQRPLIWNLDICCLVLPLLLKLLESKYDSHVQVGCLTLRLILKNFVEMIKLNLAAPVYMQGVDISREERFNKCQSCHNSLLSIRDYVLRNQQSHHSATSRVFKELHILMMALD